MLGDLSAYVARGGQSPVRPWTGGTVVRAVEARIPKDEEEVLTFLQPRVHSIDEHHVTLRAVSAAMGGGPGMQGSGIAVLSRQDINLGAFGGDSVAAKLLPHYTLALNGRQRFELAAGRQQSALDEPPSSHWMAVERDEELYGVVNAMIHAAFERHLVIQTYRPPQLEPALHDEELPTRLRQSTSAEAIEYQRGATPLGTFSDGVQVYCGLVAAIATLPHLLLLIDEPEAFLHPTLARRLGADLARIAREHDARLIAATHSAEFLLGCLEEVPNTSVLRLDYRRGVASSHLLEAAKVARLSREPVLRSANALRALFARSAMVCEADGDRAFYAEINRRLLAEERRLGASDCVALNAQNWQTTVRLAAPLREAGVPCAVLLDLETLERDEAWSQLVGMAGLDAKSRDPILRARQEARDAIRAVGRAAEGAPLIAKTQGMAGLPEPHLTTVRIALNELASIGIFPAPAGELESWLSQFGCTNKQTWVTDMLERLGAPDDPAYVHPGPGDVWEYIERVATWLENPQRRGMPVV